LAVYILPIDDAKARTKEINPLSIESAISTSALTVIKDVKPTYRESAKKIYEDEVEKGNSMIIVDPSLSFEASEIADDFSFGNGTTIGAVRLKTGVWIQCGWIVFDHADKSEVDAKLTTLKNIFKPS